MPPQEAEYHLQISPTPNVPPVKLSVVVDPLQINAGVAKAEVAAVDKVLTIIAIVLQVVVLQPPSALK